MTDLAQYGIDLNKMLRVWPKIEVGGAEGGCRYEPAYMPKGFRYAVQGRVLVGTGVLHQNEMIQIWKDYGPDGATSRSKWQIMFCNAYRLGWRGTPQRLDRDDVALKYVLMMLDEIVARIEKDGLKVTVENILDSWNTGRAGDQYVPTQYIANFMAEYNKEDA